MFLIRKLGKLLRGKVTPLQVMLACILGAEIAFVPGFAQGPGLMLAWIFLLLIANANLGLAFIIAIPSWIVALLIMPVSFQVGSFLLDGPTQGLFETLINAPVFALFGLQHYATTGSIVTGGVFGFLVGVLVVRTLKGFRARLAKLESDSARYQALTSKLWVRLLLFCVVGKGHGKLTYAELLERQGKNPIRVVGLVVVVVVVGGAWLLQATLAQPLVARALQSGLAEANGATVDLDRLELDLAGGRLAIHGLALADPNALETDVFRALDLEADISGVDLLRGRLSVDRLVISRASNGELRATPGVRVGPEPEPSEPEPATEGKTLDDYLDEAELWKERLAQVREWLQRMSRSEDAEAESEEGLRERLEREVRELGYPYVQAKHLVAKAPSFLVREIRIDQLISTHLTGEKLNLVAYDLSTHPHLVDGAPRVSVTSESGKFELALGLDAFSSDPEANRLLFRLEGLSADTVGSMLEIGGEPPMKGGTLDLAVDGRWMAGEVGNIDLPMSVSLHDTQLSVPGHGGTDVKDFTLPISLRGPLDAPRVSIDDDALVDALVQAGADQLAAEVGAKADELLGEAGAKLNEQLGDKLGEQLGDGLGEQLDGAAKELIDGLPFGKKKKD